MDKISDYMSAGNIVGVYQQKADVQKFMFKSWFPDLKKKGLKISFVKGVGGKAIVLKPAPFDVKAKIRDARSFDKIDDKLSFFKESILLGEEDRQNLMDLLETGNEQKILMFLAPIFNDRIELVNGADVQAERMRANLALDGTIAIAFKDQVIAYDYGRDTDLTLTLTGTDQYTDPTADVVGDFNDIILKLSEHGAKPAFITMNSTALNLLRNNNSLKGLFTSAVPAGSYFGTKQIKDLIKQEFELEVLTNDDLYEDETGTMKKYVPDNKIGFLPSTQVKVGNSIWGTTPAEYNLLHNPKSNVAIVGAGTAVQVVIEDDPVNEQTIVSAVFAPSGEGINATACIIIK